MGIEGLAVGFCRTGVVTCNFTNRWEKGFILFPARTPFLRAARIARGYSNSFRPSHWNLTETIQTVESANCVISNRNTYLSVEQRSEN